MEAENGERYLLWINDDLWILANEQEMIQAHFGVEIENWLKAKKVAQGKAGEKLADTEHKINFGGFWCALAKYRLVVK